MHWLEKEKSEKHISQQAQRFLKTLPKYIDGQISQSYSPRDIEELLQLLQQAKNQRVILIAEKARMGKSNVLTILSKRIEQEYPGNWLVRFDLSEYMELFETQKNYKMDIERVLEFVSKEVLKLESHLEKELFKKSFEGNGFNKVVVMVDGFDEISPKYKETVIDMLQVLKRTSSVQLWVTTRLHVREYLVDNPNSCPTNYRPSTRSSTLNI